MIIKQQLTHILEEAFTKCGYDSSYGQVTKCKLAELGDFAVVGALAAAKRYRKSPRAIAHEVEQQLPKDQIFESVTIDGPGYINLKLNPDFIANSLINMVKEQSLGCKSEHYKPAFIETVELARSEIDLICQNPEPATFKNTIEALDYSGKQLDRISSIFFNLNSAETNEEIQRIAQEVSPMLTEFSNDVTLNEELFRRVKQFMRSEMNLT